MNVAIIAAAGQGTRMGGKRAKQFLELAGTPITDTVKLVNDGVVLKTLRRTELRHALTPQCFRYALLRRAYDQVDVLDPELTDESSLVERLGVNVATVEGSPRNIKITKPGDLAIGEVLLKEMPAWS